MPVAGALERGQTRYRLIRAVAQGDRDQTELAEDFGVTQQAVSAFIKRHAGEIMTARDHVLDQFAHLWITDKGARLAEIQQIIDDIETATDPDLLRVKLAALRAAAEELGQLPARMSIKVEGSIRHELIGVDPDTDLT